MLISCLKDTELALAGQVLLPPTYGKLGAETRSLHCRASSSFDQVNGDDEWPGANGTWRLVNGQGCIAYSLALSVFCSDAKSHCTDSDQCWRHLQHSHFDRIAPCQTLSEGVVRIDRWTLQYQIMEESSPYS